MSTCLIDFASPAWESIPGEHRQEIRLLVEAITAAPARGLTAWMKRKACELGISYTTLRRHYDNFRNNGGDWTVLVDKRKATAHRAAQALARQPHFVAELMRLVENHQRKNEPAFRELRRRWTSRRVAIPGYEDWPGWPQIPAGWSDSNLARIVRENTTKARMRSIRVGTSSKTNPFLPHVLTTRVGLHPGAIIQIDDVWHDNLVTLGKKRELVRAIELGAMDVFSACRFHFGAKPRRRRDSGSWETILKTDTRMFLAGMLHRFGYSPAGTVIMSENATAKVDEDIARTLYDATRGMVRVDYQPIEGRQGALCGFWPGTEGGNFRAKALLESSHNLIHNDLAALPLQLGSPTSGLAAPVTTDRVVAYIARVMREVLAKVPHRADLLKLPTLDFHSQFYPLLVDYYQIGLNDRTEHELEGWDALGFVVNEYTTLPGSGQYFTEEILLALPEISQLAIREAAKQDPASWSRRRKLSPAEVWKQRPAFSPVPPVVLCDLLGHDLAREVIARRGFLEFSDQEISADPLIYQARFVSGPNAGREIPHGERVRMFVMPFDDTTAMVIDAKERFLGEVPLYKRILPIDLDAFGSSAPWEARPEIRSGDLIKAAGEKHARIADILEPSRILHAGKIAEARELREHNRKVIAGEPVTPEEIAEARSAAGEQAHRTAAANRLQKHGGPFDPASYQPESSSAWDDLPDDEPLPDAL